MIEKYFGKTDERHLERHLHMLVGGLVVDIHQLTEALSQIGRESPSLGLSEMRFIEKQLEGLQKEATTFEIKLINLESKIGEEKSRELREAIKDAYEPLKRELSGLSKQYGWQKLNSIKETLS
ncbi:MAG: hypothetical protein NUV67_05025 [archaeon]|nr:hypothetical protein [archaeon]